MSRMPKIVVTGGGGRFGSVLKKKVDKNYYFPSKKEFNILNEEQIIKYLKKIKPKFLIHLAGLSRPMSEHETNIIRSINLNIIGTANIVKCCSKLNIKLIYFSTSYIYQGKKGNNKETDPLLPNNNYAWSKLGAEAAVQMYKNSLILRVSMTEKPFVHEFAFADMITNFIFHDEFIKIFKKIINQKGIINIGGKTRSVYDFARKYNSKIKKIYLKKNKNLKLPINSSMNLSKLNKILKKK
ncbi:sugar nucleotide-binding protein [Pelagibacteraceae bacterium]|nr:sugar nucleotide-binding protein [Pelagibacteraceae bacterium]